MEAEWFTVVTDDSGHDYVVPLDLRDTWYRWREIPEDDPESWNTPDYAVRIDGGPLIFKTWRIGR